MKINAALAAAFMLTAGGMGAGTAGRPRPAAPWQQGMSSDQSASTPAPRWPASSPAARRPETATEQAQGARRLQGGSIRRRYSRRAFRLAIGDKGHGVSSAIATRATSTPLQAMAASVRSRSSSRGLNSPNGVLFHKGTLFVAERERILR